MMKIFGIRTKPVQYSSTPTRFFSAQDYMGGAEGQETYDMIQPLPIDSTEDLEAKFKSGVNRTDIPRMWGHPSVDRKLAEKKMLLANDMAGWRRQNGEVLYKK